MMKKFFALILILLFAKPVSAHGLATSKQQIVGKYLIEFEYDTAGNVLAGDYQNYNFDILDANTKAFINFDHAFVRFAKAGGDVVEVADITPTDTLGAGLPSARLGTVFADPGNYTLELYFFDKDNNQLALANYNFTIVAKDLSATVGTNGHQNLTLDIILLAAGFIVGFIVRRAKKFKAG